MNYLIHKPYGYLSQFVCELPRKKLLGELYNFPERVMAIGRLDEESEGLLLLTQDGMMSELVRSQKVEKEYWVQLDGIPNDETIRRLQSGVEIGFAGKKYTTHPCAAFQLKEVPEFPTRTRKIRDDRHGPTSWISITLTEGKYRQVRKMCAAVGFPVLRLFRVRIGKYKLGSLKAGEVIELESIQI